MTVATDSDVPANPSPKAGLSDAELERLVDAALNDEGGVLRDQAAYLTRTAIDAVARAHTGDLAAIRVDPPASETEMLHRAEQAVDDYRPRAIRRLVLGFSPRLAWPMSRWHAAARKPLDALQRDRELAADAVAQARESQLFAARVARVKEPIRALINASEGERYGTRLSVARFEGLAESTDSRFAVTTGARRKLQWLLDNLTGGSVGLAGPRGAGKSTLMHVGCERSLPEGHPLKVLPLIIAAPVEFEPREFILHLFAELCQKVLGPEVEQLRAPEIGDEPRDTLARSGYLVLRFGPAIAAVAGAVTVFINLAPAHWHLRAGLVWGGLLLLLGVVLIAPARRALYRMLAQRRWRREQGRDDRRPGPRPGSSDGGTFADAAYRIANRRLSDIWFQQSFTSGWSGTITAPIGQLGLSSSRELAKNQMSLPDVVSGLRELVAVITATHQVRIGIDELDKIDSLEGASRFMNEIKVLFLIPNCFFLISVSEDAMSSFERRGLPFRDVFDSSFDDVVSLGYLEARGALDLIERRIVGLRRPFTLLCHCLSGGLPRDLVRAARDVVTLNAERRREHEGAEDLELSAVCASLVAGDVRVKADAAILACRPLPPSATLSGIRAWLHEARNTAVTSRSLLDRCQQAEERLGRLAGQPTPQEAELASEFVTFCLYAATLLEFFDESSRTTAEFLAAAPEVGPGTMDQLVSARQDFAVDPKLAWAGISSFRDRFGLKRIPWPVLSPPSD